MELDIDSRFIEGTERGVAETASSETDCTRDSARTRLQIGIARRSEGAQSGERDAVSRVPRGWRQRVSVVASPRRPRPAELPYTFAEPHVQATVAPNPAKGRVPRFAISRHTRAFRRAFFPEADDHSWNDWRWQLRHSLRGLDAIERVLQLSDDERAALQRNRNSLPNAITPYYASLLDRSDASDPLRRTMVMATQEFERTPEESIDPLSEDADSPVPGLVHRYPDRVLFLVTGTCPVYCRYCTRSRMVGSQDGEYEFSTAQWERAIDYIARTPAIRDVLLSGGDPLRPVRRSTRVVAVAPSEDPSRRVPSHRLKGSGRAAAARHAGAHENAEEISPAVDEPALHSSRRS